MRDNYNGVKFYSSTDLSCGYSLEKAEKILQTFSLESDFSDINYIIELFNIKKFFDTDLRLKRWTDAEFENYKKTTKKFDKIISVFFSTIRNDNFLKIIESVDGEYIDDFWFLIGRLKTYENISECIFIKAIEQPGFYLYPLLKQKRIVFHYGQAITNHMLKSCSNAELLLSQFLEINPEPNHRLWFPKELTGELKEKIILNYIRSEEANPNYLELIAESQNTSGLSLHDKIRLEARKKYEAYLETHLGGNRGFVYGAKVVFSKTQDEIILNNNNDENEIIVSYSSKWIKENQDYPTLLNNFIYLFGYTDRFFRSQFVSQPARLGVLERLMGVKGIKHYETGVHYKISHMLFNLQMIGYYRELLNLNIELEHIFKWFFESYLVDEFQAVGFTFLTPSSGTTEIEKCKLIASEIDSVLKQFSMFVKEGGCIDRELFEMSSEHMALENVPSLLQEKYIYPRNDVCKNSMYFLFSDQSRLIYTKKTQSRYVDFYSLIKNETMYYDDFIEYQKPSIKWLSRYECININDDGILTLNFGKVNILKDMYNNQVSCLKYLGCYQNTLNNMLNSNELYCEASLFSRPEQAYINYILNRSEFSNGYDLRNKYIHGTHSLREEDHKRDYIELLKIMVLIVIKINEEFCLFSANSQLRMDFFGHEK